MLIFGVIAFVTVNDEKIVDLRQVLEIWNRWDAPHYLDLARYGYNAGGPATCRCSSSSSRSTRG